MIDPISTQRALYRLLFVALAGVILFVQLLPLNTGPQRIPGPDLLLCLTFVWIQRRPDYLPLFLLAGVMFLADILLMRPPGLWTALVLLGSEFLRTRQSASSELPFAAEWGLASVVVMAVTLANIAVLSVLAPAAVRPALAMVQALMTVTVYPAVVLLCQTGFNIHRLTVGDVELRGTRG